MIKDVNNTSKSKILFSKAKTLMPGGVNSPVRAFNAVGTNPIFIKSSSGNTITDVDNNVYLDYVLSWGPMILGHNNKIVQESIIKACYDGISFGAATELEVNIASLIVDNIPFIDMIRMVNSGTEACMSAIRLARGYTKKNKIIKFEGCYHGHSDSMLVKAGSGALTYGAPNSMGVTTSTAQDTLTAIYNDLDSVEELFINNSSIAAVIVEPVAANMGVIAPKSDFLLGLRKLCDRYGALLIFDEVITGFRLSFGGASEYFNVTPDIVTYGKIIGGGMPVGAYGGRKEIMEYISPLGGVYQAGTLSGNPIAMTAGFTTLNILLNNKQIYNDINILTDYFAKSIREITDYTVNQIGSLICLFFTKNKVENYSCALLSDTNLYKEYFRNMLDNNIYIAPSQFEALFLSSFHTKEDIDKTIFIIKQFFESGG